MTIPTRFPKLANVALGLVLVGILSLSYAPSSYAVSLGDIVTTLLPIKNENKPAPSPEKVISPYAPSIVPNQVPAQSVSPAEATQPSAQKNESPEVIAKPVQAIAAHQALLDNNLPAVDSAIALVAVTSRQAEHSSMPAVYLSSKISDQWRDTAYKIAAAAAFAGVVMYLFSYDYARRLLFDRPTKLAVSTSAK